MAPDGSAPARRYGLGLAIGGLPVTLEELVRAYTVLAGDGRRIWSGTGSSRGVRRGVS